MIDLWEIYATDAFDGGVPKLGARALETSLDIASRRVLIERRAKKLFAKKDSIGGPRGCRRG